MGMKMLRYTFGANLTALASIRIFETSRICPSLRACDEQVRKSKKVKMDVTETLAAAGVGRWCLTLSTTSPSHRRNQSYYFGVGRLRNYGERVGQS